VDAGTSRNLLEDGGVDSGPLNPSGVLSRRVPLDQRQSFADAVEQVGRDEGDVPAREDIEFDHAFRLYWSDAPVNGGASRGEGRSSVDMSNGLILSDSRDTCASLSSPRRDPRKRKFD